MQVIVPPGTKPPGWGLTAPPSAHRGAPCLHPAPGGPTAHGGAGKVTPVHCRIPGGWGGVFPIPIPYPPSHVPHPYHVSPIPYPPSHTPHSHPMFSTMCPPSHVPHPMSPIPTMCPPSHIPHPIFPIPTLCSPPHVPHPHLVSPVLTPYPPYHFQVSRALTARLTSMSVTLTRATTGPARTALPPSPASASPATRATAVTSTSTSARASPAKMGGPARTGTTPTTASA